MVYYLNDTPFKGVFNAPDHLKHCSAVQQILPTEFNGSTNNVWNHKNEFIHWMEATGLVSKFEVIIWEHLRPAKDTEELWTTDPQCFEKINFLLNYLVMTLPLVKAMRDTILSTLAMMIWLPMTASQAGALELSSKQHYASGLPNVCPIHGLQPSKTQWMHMRKITMAMGSSLCGCASSKSTPVPPMRQSSPPNKLYSHWSLSLKISSTTALPTVMKIWKIQAAGDWIMSQHFRNMFNSLKETHSEEFRLQILTWSQNWCTGIREGSTWMVMQLLAKIDLEYTHLKNLGQWQISNLTIKYDWPDQNREKTVWGPIGVMHMAMYQSKCAFQWYINHQNIPLRRWVILKSKTCLFFWDWWFLVFSILRKMWCTRIVLILAADHASLVLLHLMIRNEFEQDKHTIGKLGFSSIQCAWNWKLI